MRPKALFFGLSSNNFLKICLVAVLKLSIMIHDNCVEENDGNLAVCQHVSPTEAKKM